MARTKQTARWYPITPSQLHSPLPTHDTAAGPGPRASASAPVKAGKPLCEKKKTIGKVTESCLKVDTTKYLFDSSDSDDDSESDREPDSETKETKVNKEGTKDDASTTK
jgi:hypothetical protein